MSSSPSLHGHVGFLKALTDSFGPDEGVEFTQSAWASIHEHILAVIQSETRDSFPPFDPNGLRADEPIPLSEAHLPIVRSSSDKHREVLTIRLPDGTAYVLEEDYRQLERELAEKVENERAYERIIGRMSYEEVADDLRLLESLRSAVASVEAIPVSEIEAEIAHIEENGARVRELPGMTDEGRCRELCAMYLREFVINLRAKKRLAELFPSHEQPIRKIPISPEIIELAERWAGVHTDESYGPQGKHLGILARAVLDAYSADSSERTVRKT